MNGGTKGWSFDKSRNIAKSHNGYEVWRAMIADVRKSRGKWKKGISRRKPPSLGLFLYIFAISASYGKRRPTFIQIAVLLKINASSLIDFMQFWYSLIIFRNLCTEEWNLNPFALLVDMFVTGLTASLLRMFYSIECARLPLILRKLCYENSNRLMSLVPTATGCC